MKSDREIFENGTGLFTTKETSCHEIMKTKNVTNIGTEKERCTIKKNREWFYLNKLNITSIGNFTLHIKIPLEVEIKRLISILNISHNGGFIHRVFFTGLQYYKQMKKGTLLRSPEILAPIALYISCLENFIFIRLKDLYDNMRCKKKTFTSGLREIYKKNIKTYQYLHSDNFRKCYIYGILIGIKNHFNLCNNFLTISQKLLDEYYYDFRNKKDTVITLFLCAMTRDFLKGNLESCNFHISEFLGVKASVLSNNKQLWKEGET